MNYQDILDGICRHKANPLADDSWSEIKRKIDEIEWALQALCENLRDNQEAEGT